MTDDAATDAASNASSVPGIAAKNVSVVYRNGNVALRDASFEVPQSSICALVGVNGSGKSTLFKAIMGFVPLTHGSVSLLGQPAGKTLARNTVAYVPQNEEVDWDFPVLVEDVVMMGRYGHMGFLRRPSARDREIVDQALVRVDMIEHRERQIGELSGGQKKRVFLARALAQEGQVILLDEPFTGVDVSSEDAIIELLRGLRDEGHVMLVSTHNLGSVPQFCDQVVLINRTVLAYGRKPNPCLLKKILKKPLVALCVFMCLQAPTCTMMMINGKSRLSQMTSAQWYCMGMEMAMATSHPLTDDA